MAEQNATETGTETGSPIESGIEETWDHYAYIDDGEHAIVVGVEWADYDAETVRYAVYVTDAGLVEQLQSPEVVELNRLNNLADAAVQIRDDLKSYTIEIARDYWD